MIHSFLWSFPYPPHLSETSRYRGAEVVLGCGRYRKDCDAGATVEVPCCTRGAAGAAGAGAGAAAGRWGSCSVIQRPGAAVYIRPWEERKTWRTQVPNCGRFIISELFGEQRQLDNL